MNKFKALPVLRSLGVVGIVILTIVFNLNALESKESEESKSTSSSSSPNLLDRSSVAWFIPSTDDSEVLPVATNGSLLNLSPRSVPIEASNMPVFNGSYSPALNAIASQSCIQQMKRFMQNHLTLKNSILPMLLMMYLYRNKMSTYLNVIKKVMQLTKYEKGFLVFLGGCWTLIFLANKGDSVDHHNHSLDDSSSYSSTSIMPALMSGSNQLSVSRHNRIITRQVLQESGLSSGYHAIKNGIYVYQEIAGKISNQDCRNHLFSHDEKLKKTIYDARGLDSVDNLSEQLINKVLEKWEMPVDMDQMDDEVNDIATWYSVMSNELAEESLYQEDGLIDIIDSFRNDLEKIHLFILGKPLKNETTHWISIVVHKKDNKFNYYAMNSYSGYSMMTLAEKLKKFIGLQDIGFLKIIREIKTALGHAQGFLTSNDFKLHDFERKKQECILECLKYIELVAEKINENNLQSNAILKKRFFKEIQTIIKTIDNCCLVPINRKMIDVLSKQFMNND